MPLRFLALLTLFCSALLTPRLVASAAAATAPTLPAAAPAPQDKASRVLKALDLWMKAYSKGRYDLTVPIEREDSIAEKLDVLPPMPGGLTHLSELQALLELAAKQDTPESVEAILEVAAVGLDGSAFKPEQQPHAVRYAAEKVINEIENTKTKAHVLALATQEIKPAQRKKSEAVRTAALRALGRLGDPTFRPALEKQLTAKDPRVRLAAADGLRRMAPEASLEPLAAALVDESDPFVITSLAEACSKILEPLAKDPKSIPRAGLNAVQAAITAIGRGSWRSDMALIALLEKFRNKQTVPALIKVLERFMNHPEDVRSGKLSGILQHRAHELLVSLTGALYPMDRPDQWVEFWNREQDGFELAKEAPKKDGSGTAAKGFFGIPVQGTRITFIMDVSGSMQEPMTSGTASEGRANETRLDAAKRELLKAVDALPEIASFNLVVFSNGVKVWKSDLMPATEKVKEAFHKHVAKLKADGGTNLYGGMKEGLKMKSLVWSDRYETHVDEIFLLSDGAPSVGDVVDSNEILRLVLETNRFSRVRINTVFISSRGRRGGGIGSAPSGAGAAALIGPAKFMQSMAEQNGGSFVLVK